MNKSDENIHIHIHINGTELNQLVPTKPQTTKKIFTLINLIILFSIIILLWKNGMIQFAIATSKEYLKTELEKKVSLEVMKVRAGCEKSSIEKFIFPENTTKTEFCNSGCLFSLTPIGNNFFIGVGKGEACF